MTDTKQERQKAAASPVVPKAGAFDQKKDNLKAPVKPQSLDKPKQDMNDPFAEQNGEIRKRAAKAKASTDNYSEETANKINESMNFDGDPLDDIEIEESDLKLAEKLIFDGYAEVEVSMSNFPEKKFVICSTNAEEIGMIDEIIFDIIKAKETDDGMVDLPQNKIQTFRNAIFVALGYKGCDGVELCHGEKGKYLNTIKRAIIKCGDLEIDGDMEGADKLNNSLKSAIKARARKVLQMSTPLIDYVSAEKYKFDKKMYKIMTMKGVVPKS